MINFLIGFLLGILFCIFSLYGLAKASKRVGQNSIVNTGEQIVVKKETVENVD